MIDFPDIRVAFGESDEYSFVFHKSTKLYGMNSFSFRNFKTVTVALISTSSASYSFRLSPLYSGRRSSKLVSLITSSFTGNYIRQWSNFFPDNPLQATPLFDGRAVCYPTDQALRDYLSWRQADTHINCQYNTCYWALVGAGKTTNEAQETLKVGDY